MNNAVESTLGNARTLLRMAGRHRWLALGVAAVVFVAWSAVISRVPERYEASARVYVDTQTVLKPLMAGMTYQPDIDQQVKMLARTLMSRPNIERLIAMPELELQARTAREHEDLVAKLTDQVQITPTASSNLFDISYKGGTAERARRLVAAVVDMFVRSGTTERRKDSADAEKFIDDQFRTYEGMLTESENRLKDFKMRNFSVSGVPPQDYFARVSMLTDEIDKIRADLGAAERSRDTYRKALDGQGQDLLPASAEVRGSTADIETRLEAQRRTLDELLRRDTDEHPDVIGTRHMISQLEQELGERREAERRAGPRGSSAQVSVGSPVYQRLRVSYAEAESLAAGLRSRLASAQARLASVRTEAGRGPEVEAELTQLNRDYEIIRKNYDMMVARRESALLGARMDAQPQVADFRVIDPARVSNTPAFPGRLHLQLIGFVVAAALGLLAALARDLISPTIDDTSTLRALIDRPVIGSVSLAVTPQMRLQRRTHAVRFGAAAAAVVVLQMTWIAWVALKPALG